MLRHWLCGRAGLVCGAASPQGHTQWPQQALEEPVQVGRGVASRDPTEDCAQCPGPGMRRTGRRSSGAGTPGWGGSLGDHTPNAAEDSRGGGCPRGPRCHLPGEVSRPDDGGGGTKSYPAAGAGGRQGRLVKGCGMRGLRSIAGGGAPSS